VDKLSTGVPMLTYNSLYEKELVKLVEEEIMRLMDRLSTGAAIEDFAQYKNIVGQIQGLRKIVELNNEVQFILSKK
jgi:hypothetical protein